MTIARGARAPISGDRRLRFEINQKNAISAFGSLVSGVTKMQRDRPFAPYIQRLRDAGLRPTRQRIALARLLFAGADRHVTAEMLHEEVREAGLKVSLATVYNALHQFTDAGLLREVVVDPARAYFDTNTGTHHHFFDEDSGSLTDLTAEAVDLRGLPEPPEGMRISGVDVVIRLQKAES